MRWMFEIMLALTLVLTASLSASAAQIDVLDMPGQPIKFVMFKGEIVEGDASRFYDIVEKMDRATVVLESPGGIVRDALQIGAEIRTRDFATMVLPEAECYSACGLIWVSGARRYISQSSQIGFHAAYRRENGEYRESGVANAEIGSFLTHLGLRIEAIRYFTTAGPNDFEMLTPDSARALGIEVYKQDGFNVTTPQEAPTVDIYVDRFVSYAFFKGACLSLLDADPGIISNAVEAAHREGNRLVGSEKWIDLWLPVLDRAKAEISSKGALALCLDTEAKLRSQHQPTGIDGPSYPCSKASTSTEISMCKDDGLWAKDRAISAIFFWIRHNVDAPTRKRVLSVQREWLKFRNACGGDNQCLHGVYDERLADLKDVKID